ncbi:hypothetical protein DL770_007324 [Monosporascus sp. CRB-9-2]|nr:hypothetical protein DL770_007324 [Monosporascus sp. CRB-9-2]
MKVSVFATFSVAISLAASVKVPEDAPGGLFVAPLDKRGENYDNFTLLTRHVPEKIGPAPLTNVAPGSLNATPICQSAGRAARPLRLPP